jgi:hypothetical protein
VLGLTGSAASRDRVWNSASEMNPADHVAAVVDYTRAGNGTDMRIHVSGIKQGTWCQFWVISGNGRTYVGSWMVGASGYDQGNPWYSEHVKAAPDSVRAFQVTAAGKALVTIPAA